MSLHTLQNPYSEQMLKKAFEDDENNFSSKDSICHPAGYSIKEEQRDHSPSSIIMNSANSNRHSQVIFEDSDRITTKHKSEVPKFKSLHTDLYDGDGLNFGNEKSTSSALFNLFTPSASYPNSRINSINKKKWDSKIFGDLTAFSESHSQVDSLKSDSDWIGYINDRAGYNVFSLNCSTDCVEFANDGCLDNSRNFLECEQNGVRAMNDLNDQSFSNSKKSMSFSHKIDIPNSFNSWYLSSTYSQEKNSISDTAAFVGNVPSKSQPARRQMMSKDGVSNNLKSVSNRNNYLNDNLSSNHHTDESLAMPSAHLELAKDSRAKDLNVHEKHQQNGSANAAYFGNKSSSTNFRKSHYRPAYTSQNDEWIEQFSDVEMENSTNRATNESDVCNFYSNLQQQQQTSVSSSVNSNHLNQNLSRHISRVIMVNNANSLDQNQLRSLFTQYGGPIRDFMQIDSSTLLVGFYDLRHAQKVINSLNGQSFNFDRPLSLQYYFLRDALLVGKENQGTLVIFNLDLSVTNSELQKLFGKYGEIKEIRESPNHKHKFIEFYDIRCADRAMKMLNKSELRGKKIKIEASRPGGSNKSAANLSGGQLSCGDKGSSVLPSSTLPVNSGTGYVNQNAPSSLRQASSYNYVSFKGSNSLPSSATTGNYQYQQYHRGATTASHFPEHHHQNGKSAIGDGVKNSSLAAALELNLDAARGDSSLANLGGYSKSDFRGVSNDTVPGHVTGNNVSCNVKNVTIFNGSGGNVVKQPASKIHANNASSNGCKAVGIDTQKLSISNTPSTMLEGGGVWNVKESLGDSKPTAVAHQGVTKSTPNNSGSVSSSSSSNNANVDPTYAYEYSNSSSLFSSSDVFNGILNYLSFDEYMSKFPPQETDSEEELAVESDYNNIALFQDSIYETVSSKLISDFQISFSNEADSKVASLRVNNNNASINNGSKASESNDNCSVKQQEPAVSSIAQNATSVDMTPVETQSCGTNVEVDDRMNTTHDVQQSSSHNASTTTNYHHHHHHHHHHHQGNTQQQQGSSVDYHHNQQQQQPSSPSKSSSYSTTCAPVTTEPADKYDVVIDSILSLSDQRTTLMIKNIPNKYDQEMLLLTVNRQHSGSYDFFYLPIDFKNHCNVGYAFINFIDPIKILNFYEEFNNRRWERFNSEKVCRISYARIQGKRAMIEHFKNSSIMFEDPKCRPLIFCSDGAQMGHPETFPVGSNIRPRARKELSDSYSPGKTRVYKSRIKDHK